MKFRNPEFEIQHLEIIFYYFGETTEKLVIYLKNFVSGLRFGIPKWQDLELYGNVIHYTVISSINLVNLHISSNFSMWKWIFGIPKYWDL